MKTIIRCARAAALSATVILSCATLISISPSTAGADTTASAFYLDIGGSASLGVQPSTSVPKGQRTDEGYANDLVAQEAAKGVNLDLHEIGCSGETTSAMLYGGDRCYVLPDTQLNEALTFLRTHSGENGLVTIDLGFNSVLPCLRGAKSDPGCVYRALNTVRQQLTQIVELLKSAAGANVKFIGVGHYDPFLAETLIDPSQADRAKRSLRTVQRLDDVLSSVYGSFGIPTANVGEAFKTNSVTPVAVAGLGTLPENVAQICLLTWMCQRSPMGPNIHPNDAGYEAIADAIGANVTFS